MSTSTATAAPRRAAALTVTAGGKKILQLWARDGHAARRTREAAVVRRTHPDDGLLAIATLGSLGSPEVAVRGTSQRVVHLTAFPPVFPGHGAIPFEAATAAGTDIGAVWTSRDNRGDFRVVRASDKDRVVRIVKAHLTADEALTLALDIAAGRAEVSL